MRCQPLIRQDDLLALLSHLPRLLSPLHSYSASLPCQHHCHPNPPQVLHSTGATKLLELLGVGNTLVARTGTVYTADTVLLPFFHSHTPGSIGMSAYGAADDVRGSLFPVRCRFLPLPIYAYICSVSSSKSQSIPPQCWSKGGRWG